MTKAQINRLLDTLRKRYPELGIGRVYPLWYGYDEDWQPTLYGVDPDSDYEIQDSPI